MEDEIESADGERGSESPAAEPLFKRRDALRVIGGTAVAGGLFTGSASAHISEGKEISWVAFCGCDGGFNVRYTRCDDEGELGAVAYDCDGGTVYYKAGRDIYRHEHTRRNEDSDPNNDTGGYHVIEVDYAGNEDPVASTNPSDSRDPCGILGGGDGTKLEADELLAIDPCEGGSDAADEDGSGPPAQRGGRSDRAARRRGRRR